MGDGDEALREAARQALDAARARPADATWPGFAPPQAALRAPGVFDARTAELGLDQLLADTRDMAAELRAAPEVGFASASDHAYRFQVAVANTRGLRTHERGTAHIVRCEASARRGGAERTMDRARYARSPVAWRGLPAEVAELARAGLDARGVERGARTVVFAAEASSALGNLLAKALNGRRAHLGQSALTGRWGERVYSEALTVREDLEGGFRSGAFDDEGVPTRDKVLVERGVLRSFLWDHAGAAMAGERSTGNAVRAAPRYQNAPGAAPMNLTVLPGKGDWRDLAAQVQDGVLVRGSVMGLAQSNPASGDFSLLAPCAWRIERGEVTHALPRASLAGNVHRCLAQVEGIAADVDVQPYFALPSLAVGGIVVAT
jgi:PmbA protein